MRPTPAKMKSLLRMRKMGEVLKVRIASMAPVFGRTSIDRYHIAPPAAKKRKTAPASNNKDAPEVVSDEEEEEEEEEPEEASDEEAAPVEDEEDDDGEGAGHSADEANGDEATAKSSGPAASAKATKGSVVPKEDDLEEVKGDSE